jgi:hypothetical protein
MTGTPSRTATAHDDGETRRSVSEERHAARVGGKEAGGKAPVRGTRTTYEAVEGRARAHGGPKPESHPDTLGVYVADVWSEGHASYPGRSVCLFDSTEAKEEAVGVAVKEVPAGRGGMPRQRSERHADVVHRGRTREAAR